MAVITADLGGTRIKLGIVQEGKLLATARLEAQPYSSTEQNLEEINRAVELLINEIAIPRNKLSGIGLSLPSIVNSDTNRVVFRSMLSIVMLMNLILISGQKMNGNCQS
ncbi:MAG: hypothetical protein WKG06_09950 [Segetibacter sp.]